jgi:lysophospholipase L1-like esterase
MNASKLLVGVFMLVFISSKAQQRVDSFYLSSYYIHKVSQFKLMPNTAGEIFFLGDSITDIAEWAELFGNKNIKNRGISTDNTFGVLARLDEVVESKPTKIFLMIGINDMAKRTPDNIIVQNIQRIEQYIHAHSPKTALIIQSILPTNNEFPEFAGYQNKDEHIKWVNKQLAIYCDVKKIAFVNLHPLFLDADNKLSKQYTSDGLHLNGQGYLLWKQVLLKKKLI